MLKFSDSINLTHEVSTLKPDKRRFVKSAAVTPVSSGLGIIFETMARAINQLSTWRLLSILPASGLRCTDMQVGGCDSQGVTHVSHEVERWP